MLTKDFRREFIPGTAGSPEVPARPEYTVCPDPPQGEWVFKTVAVYFYPDEIARIKLPPNTTGPYGPIRIEEQVWNPYTRRWYPVSAIVMYVLIGYSEWVPFPNPAEPICTTYPAQVYVPAVPAVPSRWETSPIIGWDAGANSVVTHDSGCELKWNMQRVVGAYIGLTEDREAVPEVDRLSHAIFFHQRSGTPLFRVVESGTARSNDVAYDVDDEFAIRRNFNGSVSYWRNGEKLQDSLALAGGELSAGCTLYASGDTVPAEGGV
ncbi:MAG TPA: hypothetical protein PK177_09260 [Burkholderiaceae bacterium]|nr:hypothetical protein [Burkholderiaceae bacterium]